VEHSTVVGHHFLLNNTGILAKKSRNMDFTKELTEIKLHSSNRNHKERFSLSRLKKSLTLPMKEMIQKVPSRNETV
jgi:hypothetical protein